MKTLRFLLMGVAVLLLSSAPASASLVKRDANSTLTFLNTPMLPDLVIGGQGMSTVTGDAQGILRGFQFDDTLHEFATTIFLPDPANPTLVTWKGSISMRDCTLSPDNMTCPVRGKQVLCLLFPLCGAPLTIPNTVNGTRGIGIGGIVTVNTFGKGGMKISVIGAPWTVGVVTFTQETPNGLVETFEVQGGAGGPPFTATNGGGTVNPNLESGVAGGIFTVNSPVRVMSTSEPGERRGVITWTVRFIPEPGNGLLLLVGIGGLAWLGQRRLRS